MRFRSMSESKAVIKARQEISVMRQCTLLAGFRSSAYSPSQAVLEPDLEQMRQIDALYLQRAFYGGRRLSIELQHRSYGVIRKRLQRLTRKMGSRAIYPNPQTSLSGKGHKIHPYRLSGLNIERSNQVWASDICYVPMAKGFMYLTVIMDWYSR